MNMSDLPKMRQIGENAEDPLVNPEKADQVRMNVRNFLNAIGIEKSTQVGGTGTIEHQCHQTHHLTHRKNVRHLRPLQ